jgi:hypothetical protein
LKRSNTISVLKNDSEQRKIRRINSYQSSSKNRSVNLDKKRDKSPPGIETPSIYETPKHEENTSRLIIDQQPIIMNNIQSDITNKDDQIQTGVRF